MGILTDLKKALQRRGSGAAEARYLDEATSPVDLEMRMREVDRGRFRHRSLY